MDGDVGLAIVHIAALYAHMGKRIELTDIYRPKLLGALATREPPPDYSICIEPPVDVQNAAGKGRGGKRDKSPSIPVSKPGRKPKVIVPADVQAWLTKHGLRVVPKAKEAK